MKRNPDIFIYILLILSTLLVFGQVHNFDFLNYDDNLYVCENQHVLNGLTHNNILWAFTAGHAANWHPLTWLSLMFDCQLFGSNPGRIHLVNVFLHSANTLLLFAVLKKITGSLWSSAFVAAAFALHPMHVESVAWIAERKDVLSTFFWILTVAAYAGYVKRPAVFRYMASLALFTLGLMAKPMLVTLPFILLLLDYWPLNRIEGPGSVKTHKSTSAADKHSILYHRIIEKIPFFVLAAGSSVITFWFQRTGGAMMDINNLPLKFRIANAVISYAKYMDKMFWPENLAVFYPLDISAIRLRQVALCALLIIAVSVLVIQFGRKQRYLPVGWFWFVGTLVPVIGLVQVGRQAYADRYTYIPYIGLFIIIAWGLPELLSKWPQRKIVLGMAMVIVLTALGLVARQQTSYWKNSVTLFTHATEVTQNNYIAHAKLGAAYNNLGRWQEAIETIKQAIRFKPNYAEAYSNLGVTYNCLGRWQEAIEIIKQVFRLKPDDAEAYNNLGVAYDGLGRWQEAIEAYKQAIRLKPDDAEVHHNLGAAYGRLGRYQEAIEAIQQAIKIKSDYAKAYNNLGAIYGKLSRWQDAIEAYKQAIRLKPDYAGAHYNLGIAYLAVGNKNAALEQYRILQTLDAEWADSLFKLIHQ